MPTKQAPSTKVERKIFLLKNVRLSYPNLFTARAMESDTGEMKKPEYSASYILDKEEHAEVIKAIEKEAKAIAIAKWGKVPAKFRGPIRDGSTFEDEENGGFKLGYDEDKVGISAKSSTRQHVVGRDMTPIAKEDEDTIYGGCYVNASISLYPWKHKTGGCGVSANLGAVQFYKNGERFGGSVIKPEEVFEDLGEDDDGDDEPAPRKKAAPAGKKKVAYDPTADMDDD